MSLYDEGRDVLGAGVGDFVPWLGIVGQVAGGGGVGGLMGGKTAAAPASTGAGAGAGAGAVSGQPTGLSAQEIVRQTLDQERVRRADNTVKYVAVGAVGILGLGLLALAFRK